jgi:hypothetical protein
MLFLLSAKIVFICVRSQQNQRTTGRSDHAASPVIQPNASPHRATI